MVKQRNISYRKRQVSSFEKHAQKHQDHDCLGSSNESCANETASSSAVYINILVEAAIHSLGKPICPLPLQSMFNTSGVLFVARDVYRFSGNVYTRCKRDINVFMMCSDRTEELSVSLNVTYMADGAFCMTTYIPYDIFSACELVGD